MRKTPEERFSQKVSVEGDHWMWTAGVNSNGHGTFWLDDRVQTAQRASWLLHRGPIQGELGVAGLCDLYPSCVAPGHLQLLAVGPKPRALAERFWPFVDKRSAAECWPWKGTTSARGYGAIRDGSGQMIRAHRAAWELANGPIPDDLLIRHDCDNPPCCNPGHLIPGTQVQNMGDMRRRMRANPAQGGRNFNTKLTEEQVQEIRRRHAEGTSTQAAMAREFGLYRTTVERIVHRQVWRHI